MPIYEYECNHCNYWTDKILPVSRCDEAQECQNCGNTLKKLISMPAKTASLWGVDWREGLSSNKFSTALGRKVSSKREEERVMREKGFVPESDLGKHFIDDHRQKMHNKEREQAKINDTYKANLEKNNGDKIKAVTETFPAHQMLKQS